MAASNSTGNFMLVFIVHDFLQHAVRGKKKEKDISRTEISRHIHICGGLAYQRYLCRDF